MQLCNEGRPKAFTFVSSTNVLDTDHYVNTINSVPVNHVSRVVVASALNPLAGGATL